MNPIDLVMVAGLAWALTQVVKPILPAVLDPRLVAFLWAVVGIVVLYYHFVPYDLFQLVAGGATATLGASVLHNVQSPTPAAEPPTPPAA